ncbi:hypothetical protein BC940DRAFT_303067 [Gongronella butleri]|nr:hypothetical protein BC940DRAFT_303067 [Gongronella butleri]
MNPSTFEWLDQLIEQSNVSPASSASSNDASTSAVTTTTASTPILSAPTTNGGPEAPTRDIVSYLFDPITFPVADLNQPLAPKETAAINTNAVATTSTFSISEAVPATTTTTTAKSKPAAPASVFNTSWVINTASGPDFQTTKIGASTAKLVNTSLTTVANSKKPTSASRKMLKKKREPVFVTESPQNAYKKKQARREERDRQNASSPSSHSEGEDDFMMLDENDQILDKRSLSAKERRQLRNKISARNFRVRRKEYISQLEQKVEEQEDEISALKHELKKIKEMNDQLVGDLASSRVRTQQLEEQQARQSLTPPVSLSSNGSSSDFSPPLDFDSLLDISLFQPQAPQGNNSFVAHVVMPELDLSQALGDKLHQPLLAMDGSQPHELLAQYPLLAPALASIVLQHTFSLHYHAYLHSSFPYNATMDASAPKKHVDILSRDDWVNAMSQVLAPRVESGGDGHDHDLPVALASSHTTYTPKSYTKQDKDQQGSKTYTREFEKDVLRHHYPYYVFMRVVRGMSHEEIMHRAMACRDHCLTKQKEKQCTASTAKTFQAFCDVAVQMIKQPKRMAHVAQVVQNTMDSEPKKKNSLFLKFSRPTLMISSQ